MLVVRGEAALDTHGVRFASHLLQESEVFLYLAPQLFEKVACGLHTCQRVGTGITFPLL